jgi:hypothetical protein
LTRIDHVSCISSDGLRASGSIIVQVTAQETSQSTSLGLHCEVDDIRTSYHPRSNRNTVIEPFDTYGKNVPLPPQPLSSTPWHPFHSQPEFEFAKITLQAALSNSQINALIKVIRKFIDDGEKFIIKNHGEIHVLWEKAAASLPQV